MAKKNGNNTMLWLLLLGGAGAAYYFLVYKKKQTAPAPTKPATGPIIGGVVDVPKYSIAVPKLSIPGVTTDAKFKLSL